MPKILMYAVLFFVVGKHFHTTKYHNMIAIEQIQLEVIRTFLFR